MLVGALEVQINVAVVGAIASARFHREPRHAGLEPDVDDVLLAFELRAGLAAAPALGAGGQQIDDLAGPPCVGALELEDRGDVIHGVCARVRGLARAAVERRDRRAPQALPRQHPVGAIGDHRVDPVVAPRRDPRGLVNLGERARAQLLVIHREEPLRRGAEHDRSVAAPAVWVAVADGLAGLVEQEPGIRQVLDDDRVGLVGGLTREDDLAARRVEHDPRDIARAIIEWRVRRQPVRDARLVVVGAVARRRVDEAGASVRGHVVREVQPEVGVADRPQDEWMLIARALEHGHLRRRDLDRAGGVAAADRGRKRLQQILRDDQVLLRIARARQRDIGEAGMRDDREVGRQRPRGGRPDHEREPLALELRRQLAGEHGLDDRHPDIDRRRGVILELDLGDRERGLVARAPLHRLVAAVEEAIAGELCQRTRDRRLVRRIERQVRVLPVAEHAEPLELGALGVDPAERELPAPPADVRS
ncbi:MAG: hypothetical protein WKG01_21515 [Kofleriaceae bacterium]